VRERLAWLSPTLVALLGFLQPVCALACVAGDAPAATPVAEQAAHPCHESEPAPASDPAPASHETCGCDAAQKLVRPTLDASAGTTTAALAAPFVVSVAGPPAPMEVARIALQTDLPPPDLLLRKSTLLI